MRGWPGNFVGEGTGMTRLALLHCNDLDLVPSHLRDLARQLRHPQAREEAALEIEETEPQGRRTRKWN